MSSINRTSTAHLSSPQAHPPVGDANYADVFMALAHIFSGQKFQKTLIISICSLVLILMIITFRPFADATTLSASAGGDVFNQIGFMALAMLMSGFLLTKTSFRQLSTIATPLVGIFLLAVGVSIMLTPDIFGAAKGIMLTLIVTFVAYAIIILLPTQEDLLRVLMTTSIMLLVISYAGLVLFPNEAKHITDVFEPQHYGLWRGPFLHKNIAGPIFSIVAIFGIYIARSGYAITGILIAILSFIFVINTGSKTTTGFLPLAVFMVFFARLFASPTIAVFMTIVAAIIVCMLTIGSVYSSQLEALTGAVLADTTFTGRTTLWQHGFNSFLAKPWLGYGFSNFWGTDTVLFGPLPEYAKWDFRKIVHGHNNYIDILISFGILGGSVIYAFVFIYPLINYVKAYRIKQNRRLADMFMMMIGFIILLSFMETFVLWRSDPIWVLHIFAVLGLHVLARANPTKR